MTRYSDQHDFEELRTLICVRLYLALVLAVLFLDKTCPNITEH